MTQNIKNIGRAAKRVLSPAAAERVAAGDYSQLDELDWQIIETELVSMAREEDAVL